MFTDCFEWIKKKKKQKSIAYWQINIAWSNQCINNKDHYEFQSF